MRPFVMLAAVAGLLASPLAAQMRPATEGGQRPMGMMGGDEKAPMGPLTAALGKYAPGAILAMEDHLSLTADQLTRLKALAETGQAAEREAHHPAHAAHMELRKVLAAEPPDTVAMRQFFLAHHSAEGNMQWIRASIALQAKALLTPAQRAHVEQMGGGAGHH